MSRLYVRRPSGYESPYSLSMFFVAAITRPRQFGNHATPLVRIGSKLLVVPRPLMEVVRPFNRYRDARGVRVSSFAKSPQIKE